MALFQAQQATDYVGGAASAGKHLASMGSPTMTWALAKRARDEKRSDIKLQREKEDRKFIMDSMQSAIGAMGRKRERSEDKAERDKKFEFTQSKWKEGEAGRISDLKNSLNEDYDAEMRMKFKGLEAENRKRQTDWTASSLTADPSRGDFKPTTMKEYLERNPMDAQRTSYKMAEHRYRGTSPALSKETNADSSATASAEEDEHLRALKAKEANRAARIDMGAEASEAQERETGEYGERQQHATIERTEVLEREGSIDQAADARDQRREKSERETAPLEGGPSEEAKAELDAAMVSPSAMPKAAGSAEPTDPRLSQEAQLAGTERVEQLGKDKAAARKESNAQVKSGEWDAEKGERVGFKYLKPLLGKLTDKQKAKQLKAAQDAAWKKLDKKAGYSQKIKETEATLKRSKKAHADSPKPVSVSGLQTPGEDEIRAWAETQAPTRPTDAPYEGMKPSDYRQASAEGGPTQTSPEEMIDRQMAPDVDYGTDRPDEGEVSGKAAQLQETIAKIKQRIPEGGTTPQLERLEEELKALGAKGESTPKVTPRTRHTNRLSKLNAEMTNLVATGAPVKAQMAVREKINVTRTKLRKLEYEQGALGNMATDEIAAEQAHDRQSAEEQGAMEAQQAGVASRAGTEPSASPSNLPPEAQEIEDAKAQRMEGGSVEGGAPSPGYIGNLSLQEGQEKLDKSAGGADALYGHAARSGRRGAAPTPAQMGGEARVKAQADDAAAAETRAQAAEDKAKMEKWKRSPSGKQWTGLVEKAGDSINKLMGVDQTKEGASKEDVKDTGRSLGLLLGKQKSRKMEEQRNLSEQNKVVASNEKVWDQGTVNRFFTTDEAGNVTVNPQIDEDSWYDTTNQESLSDWKKADSEQASVNNKKRAQLKSKISKLMVSDDKDAARKMIGLQNEIAAIPPNRWAGVKKHPVKFFLNNPDMLKHLNPKDRQSIQTGMLPYIKEAHNKRLKAKQKARREEAQAPRGREPEVLPGQGGEETGLGYRGGIGQQQMAA